MNDNRWIEYFDKILKDKNIFNYAIEHCSFNAQLYYQIKKYINPPSKILEVGCGYGLSSIYLQACGYKVTAIDSDLEIVNRAKNSAETLGSNLTIEHADAFNLNKYYRRFDLCFSVGVIEHFDKDVTVKLLQEQAKCAKFIIAVIPSRYTKYTGKITDERIYNIWQLKRICIEAGLIDISTFGYGDIPTSLHMFIRYCLPFGIYRILQNYFSYAMSLGCLGKSTIF
ncbi:MAG: class I SAM-dependent methyltransferase [Nitrospirae bacterium]|nr:class I SAM-dependent methyltransferase [Nitrospirota bacterium]